MLVIWVGIAAVSSSIMQDRKRGTVSSQKWFRVKGFGFGVWNG